MAEGRPVDPPDQRKVFSHMQHQPLQAFMKMQGEVDVLRGQGNFEACLEKIVEESRRHDPQCAPMFNRSYNEHYRLAVAHLPPARLNKLNARIHRGELTIKHGWDQALNRNFEPEVEMVNRRAERRRNKRQCSCGNTGVHLCGRCRQQYYCCRLCQQKDWKEHKKECPKPDSGTETT